MLKLAVLVCIVTFASARPYSYWDWGWPYYYNNPYYGGYWDPYYYGGSAYQGSYPQGDTGKLIFYGEFHGTCKRAPDGLYFVDERSFAFCSNGAKTIQPCAEGSANPPLDYFQHGHYYGYADFCSVNLVAKGYNGYPEEPYRAPYKTEYIQEHETYEEKRASNDLVKTVNKARNKFDNTPEINVLAKEALKP